MAKRPRRRAFCAEFRAICAEFRAIFEQASQMAWKEMEGAIALSAEVRKIAKGQVGMCELCHERSGNHLYLRVDPKPPNEDYVKNNPYPLCGCGGLGSEKDAKSICENCGRPTTYASVLQEDLGSWGEQCRDTAERRWVFKYWSACLL